MDIRETNGTRRPAGDLASDQRGATAVEYAIIAAMLSIMIAAACVVIGTDLAGIFNNVATSV